jgi:uncharacterized phage protein (TIGR02218 family)
VTFAQSEVSAYQGNPVEAYTFIRENKVWRFTTGEDPVTISGQLFAPRPMQRSKIEQSSDMIRNSITLSTSSELEVVDAYRSGVPSGITTILIQGYHYGIADYVTRWQGRIVNVQFAERTAKISCEPILTTILRPVLRRFYQLSCPHVLYGADCTVSRATFRVDGTLTGQNGAQLTSAIFGAKPDGWFGGGYIDWLEGDESQRRFILSHTGSNIVVNIPFIDMPNNAGVQVYPGCDHTLVTCTNKFANNLNYGGQPYYPQKNPFSGVQIF